MGENLRRYYLWFFLLTIVTGADPGIYVSGGALDRRGVCGSRAAPGGGPWGPMIGKLGNSEKVYKVINNAGVR